MAVRDHVSSMAHGFQLRGLAVVGKTYHNCLAIRRGGEFLLKSESNDGG